MCMLEMSTGEYPYMECQNPAQIYRRVTSGVQPQSIEKVSSPQVRDIIENCIKRDSTDRLTVKEVLDSEFFQQDQFHRVELAKPMQQMINEEVKVIPLRLKVVDNKRVKGNEDE